jgi:hypothetical protein
MLVTLCLFGPARVFLYFVLEQHGLQQLIYAIFQSTHQAL